MKLVDTDIGTEREFQASLHGASLKGPGTLGGPRRAHIARMKQRRGG